MPFFYISVLCAGDNAHIFYQKSFALSQKGDYSQAIIWTKKAAQLGFAPAQHNLGLSYLHGLGVKADSNAANYWFILAAQQGLADALSELAMSYYLGRGFKKNLHKAEQYWQLAAYQNDEYAQFNLASLYLDQRQFKKAQQWFNKSLVNHHPNAEAAILQLEKMGQ